MPNWKKVITSGSDASLNSLNVTSAFTASGIIYPISDGSNNQSLITDGAGNLTFGNPYSDNTVVYGKNLSGTTIEKGTPLYFTGSGTGGNLVGVFPADASNPARMPAGGIAGEQMLNEAEGVVLLDGFINGVDTSAFDSGDLVYVGVGGGYTNVAPTGSSNLIQSLGYVEKIDDTNGSGVIKGPGVSRSVPNIQQGYVWVGNEDDVPTPTATSSLSVASADQTSQPITFNNGGTGAVSGTTFNGSTARTISYNTIGAQPLLTNPVTGTGTTNYLSKFTGTSTLGNSLVYDNGTNVGIGTTDPSKNLDIRGIDPSIMIASDNSSGQASLILRGLGSNGTSNAFTEIKGIPEGAGAASSLTFDTRASSGTISEKMRITSEGRVGIGTTSPTQLFQVDAGSVIASFRSVGSGENNKELIIQTGGDRVILDAKNASDGTTTAFAFETGNSEKMRISSDGSVGIGTTIPATKLDTQGAISATYSDVSWSGVNDEVYGSLTARYSNSSAVGRGASLAFIGDSGQFSTRLPFTSAVIKSQHESSSNNERNTSLVFYNHSGGVGGTGSLTERLRITSGGNVGIGTVSPTQKLDVNGYSRATSGFVGSTSLKLFGDNSSTEYLGVNTDGTVQLTAYGAGFLTTDASGNVSVSTSTSSDTLDDVTNRGNTTTNSIEVGDIKSTGDITIDNSSGDPFLKFKTTAQEYVVRIDQSDSEKFQIRDITNNETRVTVDTSGNVGIGTTTPDVKLEIDKGAEGEYLRIGGDNASNGRALKFTSSTSSGGSIGALHTIKANSIAGEIAFANGDGTIMYLKDGGNVGIGTTNPSALLDLRKNDDTVYDPTADDGQRGIGATIQLNNNSTTTNTFGQIMYDTDSSGQAVARIVFLDAGSASSAIAFVTENSETKAEQMRIASDGKVGIGTNSPDVKLEVDVTGNNKVLKLTRDTGTNGVFDIDFQNADTNFNSLYGYSFQTDEAERMRITSTGNVGIGTTSPTAKLDVTDGNAKMVFGAASSDRSLLYFQHNAVPVDAEEIGLLDFRGYNDASEDTRYVILTAKAEDVTDGSEDGSLTFQTMKDGTATQTMTLRSGNVGIGTTSPTAKLHVLGTSTGDATTKAEMLSNSVFSVRPHATNSGTLAIAQVDGGNSVGMQFTNGAGTSNWDISLQPFGGNVGIGTTTPGRRLSVAGAIELTSADTTLHTGHAAIRRGSGGEMFLDAPGDISVTIDTNNNNTDRVFNVRKDTGSELFRVQENGNVGIGTTSPNHKLDVAGSINAGGKVTYTKAYSSLDTTGNAVAGLLASSNGSSSLFTFICHGDTGGYQKIVYSCHNAAGTWNTAKVIDEGTNDFDVTASANGSTITFTFKAASGTKGYSPKVTIEAIGSAINSTYA